VAKPAVCNACSPAARSQVWRQRGDSASLPCTSLVACGVKLGALFPTPDLSASLQTCPHADPPLGQCVQQCYLHASSPGGSYGSSRPGLRPSRFITYAAVVTEWAALCPSRILAWIAAGYLVTPRISPSTGTAPITALLINDGVGPVKAVRAKVGEHSRCCLWLGFDQTGSEEAAWLPAACGRLPSESQETYLGSGQQEKPKLPQTCRHKSGKRNGGTAVCEVLVSSDLGGCILRITPWHLHCAGSHCSRHPGCLRGIRRMGKLWVLPEWLWQEG